MKVKLNSNDNLLFLAWATAIIAMFGSLYFSEIRQYEPCTLCWYQRIVMYPFTVLLGIAVIRKEYWISIYASVLSLMGGIISFYHYLIQNISFFSDNSPSCGRIPCSGKYINWFGFITIPFLALIAFIIIFLCTYIIYKRLKEN
ncbi:disulfide bond formation protein B [Bacillus thuringiensis]|uniref:disulfide oxidoreductase n=1 Tax=Bacillus TaxID=1386 RepID=UPI000BF405B3|nr:MULTISPECIES: disulfide oxidoreductase [Bacillus cereus group]MBV6708163.1 disulfide bond formation protein B [Bacillus thuringiensis]PFL80259.1 disulfide bond formation protein B [Bacillus cereus]PFN66208.1 disulfide bond formation protein B [Bacillus cereus]HEK9102739.1 disulfide bond formation protein B [Bacillus pseudomycoides]